MVACWRLSGANPLLPQTASRSRSVSELIRADSPDNEGSGLGEVWDGRH